MIEIEQSETFRKWEAALRDRRVRVIVASRINRLAEGHPGDVEPVGEGVSELRIHYGPGYRVYFHQAGKVLLLLLCGGDKGSQRRDITAAKKILRDWRNEHG